MINCYIVTIKAKRRRALRIRTWASSVEQAIRQVADFEGCPLSICTAKWSNR